MLRGAVLKNTEEIVGVAVYTGNDSKIMMNAEDPRYKQSNIDLITNRLILAIIGLQLIMSLVVFVLSWIWHSNNSDRFDFNFRKKHGAFTEAIFSVLTLFVLLNTMIPISLIVSLEIVKLWQAYYINKDEDMYDPKEDRYANTFNSSLNEELGQI